MSETYIDWKTPIRSLILKENFNLGLIFPIDVRKKPEFEVIFFRVARVAPLKRVYVLPEITPGSTQSFNYLGEQGFGQGTDIFEMSEERPFRILHFGIGIYPPELWVYRQQPAGFTITAWSKRAVTQLGDPLDYITGEDSPFEEPTRISETVMWYKGSLTLAYINKSPITVTPRFHFLGAGYDLIPIRDKNLADRMVRGTIPARFLTIGGLAEIRYTVPDEWFESMFRYKLEDLQAIMRG